MGRPKLSDLYCTICNIKFKRKTLLDEHMENHLSPTNESRQPRKQLKNYCYVCRKSFDPDKYKLHIQTEHRFDLPKMNNNDTDKDLYSYENGYVILSKRKIKNENQSPKKKSAAIHKSKSLGVSFADIKVEPTDNLCEEPNCAVQKNALKVPKLKCSVCGMKCKGEKGLKIHMSAHKKRSQDNSDSDASQSENDESTLPPALKVNSINSTFNNSANVPLLLSNNGAVNFAQNAQPNYVLNGSNFQNQSNNLANVGNNPNNVLQFGNQIRGLGNSTNQPSAQFLQSKPNQKIKGFKDIPKFDCDSEKYMKWLKKFVSKCKLHNYPLNSELCMKVSFVTEEITTALGNPQSSLKQKANHFYFMSMYNMLTEIMLNHLQHKLCGVKKQKVVQQN